MKGRIELSERLISRVECPDVDAVWRRDAGGLHNRLAGFVDTRPDACADAREQRRAVRRALFGGYRFHRAAVDVGLNLPPQRGSCTAAADADPLDGNAQFLEDREAVAQAERHAFEPRAD